MATFIILGIIQGAEIGMIAIGIVLVYKGSRVFNFAQAEFGSVAAYVLFGLSSAMGVPYMIALVAAIVAAGLMGYIVERLVVRPLFNAPRVTLLVATAGVALLAIALEIHFGELEVRQIGKIIEGNAFTLFGTAITYQQLIALAVLGGLAIGLAYFFNKTDLGLAVLATSQEAVATELVGIGAKRMSSFVWTLAAVLGGIAGLLQAPDTTFFPGFMTRDFLLLGFTAAVIGGITSLAGGFIGGMLIGLVQSLGSYFDSKFISDIIDIPSVPDVLVFILLLSVLLIRPKGLLGKEA